MGVTMLMAIFYVLVNLIVDLMIAFVDPRIRLGRTDEIDGAPAKIFNIDLVVSTDREPPGVPVRGELTSPGCIS